jgi:signal transduction histidine kinase
MKHFIGFETPLEPGLLKIFRLFCALVSVAFLMLSLISPAGTLRGLNNFSESGYYLTASYVLAFTYLSIPLLRRKMGIFYLPLVLAFVSYVPIGLLNWLPLFIPDIQTAATIINSWTITALLLFPLIILAWQYEFRVILIFFGVLGLLDPLILILNTGIYNSTFFETLYSSLVRMAVFTAVGFVITELKSNQKFKQNELEKANAKLTKQAEMIDSLSAMRERTRISRELHDVLAHTLSGLAVQLEAMKTVVPEENSEFMLMIDHSLKNARSGLAETRSILKDLRSLPQAGDELLQAIKVLIHEFSQNTDIPVQVNRFENIPDLPADLLQVIHRIIQESLENTRKHADADQIIISLYSAEDSDQKQVYLLIEDNGKGFQPDYIDESEHFGLRGIRERVQAAGGSCKITSNPEKGTKIRCQFLYATPDQPYTPASLISTKQQ